MHLADITNRLKYMYYIEQILLSQVHPSISMFIFSGQQLGRSRNVIKFKQNIQQFALRLPYNPEECSSTILVNKASSRV